MTIKRINLWSSPRNISTAMMYSFAQRPDTIVFDEPLYAHYLRVTGIEHPGKEEILESQENDGDKVVQHLMMKDYQKSIAFFKQMTHHLISLNESFLTKFSNIIFIRDPKQIISSYSVVRPDVTMQDIGMQKQWQLYNQLCDADHPPVVLDSNELLAAPEKVLRELCDALEISFYEQMLYWQAGARPEDGVWAKHWYANVHASTGFEKQNTSSRELPEYLQPLYEECKPLYEQLYIHSIKA